MKSIVSAQQLTVSTPGDNLSEVWRLARSKPKLVGFADGRNIKMTNITKEDVRNLLGDLTCSSGLACIEHGLKQLCKAKDIGHESYLVCLDLERQCSFTTFSEEEEHYWCTCPVRMHIKRTYNR